MPFNDARSEAEVRAHHRLVRRCKGRACLQEAFWAFGTTSCNELETKLSGKAPSIDNYGQPMWSGKCRRWQHGTALPSDESIAVARQVSGGKADLGFWRDLPLWELLEEPKGPPLERVLRVMAALSPEVREILFLGWRSDAPNLPVLAEMGDLHVAALRELRSLDAFTALLALARQADAVNNDQRHAVLATTAYSIFGDVVSKHPQLRACFDDLFDAVAFSFWSCWYLHGVRQSLPKYLVIEHLQRLGGDADASCALSVGRLEGMEEGDPVERMMYQYCAVIGWTR